jgi:hypothetical protein
MKYLITWIALIGLLPSCKTYQNISRGAELTEATLRTKVISGKKYAVKLNSGKVLYINVNSVDSVNIYGVQKEVFENKMIKYPFIDSFENFQRSATRISVYKFNPWLTTAGIVVPIAFLSVAIMSSIGWD